MKLNAAQIAALKAGATPEAIAALATAPEANLTEEQKLAAEADAKAAADVKAAADTKAAADAEAATKAAADAAAKAAVAQPSELVAHLQTQLTEANTALLATKVEAEGYKTKAAATDGLVEVLRTAIGEKLVALGGSADIAAAYTAENIAAEFKRIDGVYKTQFRVGGVAAAASPEEKPNTKATVSPMFAAAVENSLVK
jgi:hypothetical protein